MRVEFYKDGWGDSRSPHFEVEVGIKDNGEELVSDIFAPPEFTPYAYRFIGENFELTGKYSSLDDYKSNETFRIIINKRFV